MLTRMSIAGSLLLLIIIASVFVFTANDPEPVLNDGEKWQVAYYQGGDFIEYTLSLEETIYSLSEMGWVQEPDFPQDKENTSCTWQYISTELDSDYIEFVDDAYWSANWTEDKRYDNKKHAIERLNQGDIDLVIAMGTWAGQDLANDLHSTNTVVLSTSDPIRAGIIADPDGPEFEHLYVPVDTERHKDQIRIFHEVVQFNTLGLAFENSPEGRSYAAFEDVMEVSREKGFEVLREETIDHHENDSIVEQSYTDACKLLAPRVDAFYITEQGSITDNNIMEVTGIFKEYKVPTFSQSASRVSSGALMSAGAEDFQYMGDVYALAIANIFNGNTPAQLDQTFEQPRGLVLNLDTADTIGFEFPPGVIESADIIISNNTQEGI